MAKIIPATTILIIIIIVIIIIIGIAIISVVSIIFFSGGIFPSFEGETSGSSVTITLVNENDTNYKDMIDNHQYFNLTATTSLCPNLPPLLNNVSDTVPEYTTEITDELQCIYNIFDQYPLVFYNHNYYLISTLVKLAITQGLLDHLMV
ncbi:hypothetical protein LCGC14_2964060 [marine sediment metagenome]|uniref:Uncharacterized protein n=1 Tax=marine sediment metagenome TaxID=412755 RepID=A0A0F8XBE1_9ZZZZ